jgi:N,N-dimethyl phenylurea N-demethylase beta subunit
MDPIQLRDTASQFLATEAMLLDEGRFEEWFALLDDDLEYLVPIRVGANTRAEEMAGGGYRQRDSKQLIRQRIDRLRSGAAYSESPPSRTVRSVSAVCLLSETDNVASISSTLIVYRHRGNDLVGDAIHARRNDRLRLTATGPLLLSRSVILAEVSLSTPNLGIFL